MIVEYGEFKYIVKWEHTPYPCQPIHWHPNNGKTLCEVIKMNEDGTPGTEIRGAFAYCSQLEQYNKNKGRKVSMKRAICNFNKWERKHFWNAYKKMRNGKY